MEVLSPADLEAAGLYDPGEEHAVERLELLQLVAGLGATLEEMIEAREDLQFLATVVPLRPGRERLTLREVADRAGVPYEDVVRFCRAGGFPDLGDRRFFTEADVEVVQAFRAAGVLVGEDVTLQVARVIGVAMARVAEALVSAFMVNVGAPALAEDPVGLALARANAESTALLPLIVRSMDVALRHHIELAKRPLTQIDEVPRGYEALDLTVGFVDLVGSTTLSQRLSAGELGAALSDFEARSADIVVAAGARLVKLIGDEVMFVAADPAAACGIALDVAETFVNDPVLPPVRGGLACGQLLTRDGDYFGPMVNLAARAVKIAEPNAVVVSDELRGELERAGQAFRFTPVPPAVLKGFAEDVQLHRVTRA